MAPPGEPAQITAPQPIVLIEDNEWDVRAVNHALRGGNFHVRSAISLVDGIPWLHEDPPPVMLLDLGLADSQGLETLRRAHAAAPLAPIVVLTALDDELVALGALEQGAQYYLTKDRLNTETLRRAIELAILRKGREQDAEMSVIARSTLRDLLGDLVAATVVDRVVAENLGRRMMARASAVARPDAPALTRLAKELGIGRLSLVAHEGDRYEFEGHDLIERHPGSRTPTCHLAVGFLAGYVASTDAGAPVLATEVACESRGDSACRFRVRQRHGPPA